MASVCGGRQADVALLYRSAGRGSQLTPRLVLCDAVDSFGSLNSEGIAVRDSGAHAPPSSLDALAWGGSVQEVAQESRAAHAFVQMMGAPVVAEGGQSYYADEVYRPDAMARASAKRSGDDGDDRSDEYDDDDDDDDGGDDEWHRRQPSGSKGRLASWGVPARSRRDEPHASTAPPTAEQARSRRADDDDAADDAEEEEEALRAAAFDFEGSVECWSDYLQAHLHPRSLARLKPHVHGYSTLSRFPDGACVVQREEDTPDSPALVERVRRYADLTQALA